METKVCKKCGRELPISEFYIHKEMGDGHLNFVKDVLEQEFLNTEKKILKK